MAIVTPDFSESSASGPVVAGTYKTRIEACETKQSGPASKNPGSPYLQWTLRIFGAEGDARAQNNRTVSLSTMLSGPGAGILRQFVKTATGQEPKGPFDTDSLLGKEIEVQVTDNYRPDGTQGWPNVKPLRGLNL